MSSPKKIKFLPTVRINVPNPTNLERFREEWRKQQETIGAKAMIVPENTAQQWWSAQSASDQHDMATLKFGSKTSYKKMNANQIEQLYKEFGTKKKSNANRRQGR